MEKNFPLFPYFPLSCLVNAFFLSIYHYFWIRHHGKKSKKCFQTGFAHEYFFLLYWLWFVLLSFAVISLYHVSKKVFNFCMCIEENFFWLHKFIEWFIFEVTFECFTVGILNLKFFFSCTLKQCTKRKWNFFLISV